MDKREEIKNKIIARALVHVPYEGWSQEILDRSADEIGVGSSYGWRLFPQGPLEAVITWSRLLDEKMLISLPDPENLRVRDRVSLAIKTRLNILSPHREAARKTSTYLALPHHIGKASQLLYATVNAIWYYAGDTSTDYNFYTKRALLAWVYSSTFLYWLQDDSEDHHKTWMFLDRRIEEVLTLPKLPKRIFQKIMPWSRHV